MRKVFEYNGMGHWIGATVIVFANDKSEAIEIINKALKSDNLAPEATEETTREVNEQIIYFNNGTY